METIICKTVNIEAHKEVMRSTVAHRRNIMEMVTSTEIKKQQLTILAYELFKYEGHKIKLKEWKSIAM